MQWLEVVLVAYALYRRRFLRYPVPAMLLT